jgi:hypothetical protein
MKKNYFFLEMGKNFVGNEGKLLVHLTDDGKMYMIYNNICYPVLPIIFNITVCETNPLLFFSDEYQIIYAMFPKENKTWEILPFDMFIDKTILKLKFYNDTLYVLTKESGLSLWNWDKDNQIIKPYASLIKKNISNFFITKDWSYIIYSNDKVC